MRPPPSGRTATLVALIFAAIALVAPFGSRGVACGHDLVFHMNGWLEVQQQWRDGVLYPRWAANANYGAGEPRFLFYPPLSCILGGALGSVVPWLFVPVAFDVCIVVLAGWTMYLAAREWFKQPDAALIAVAYAVNPYMLLNIYARSAYGELLASAFFPLLLLWIVRDRPARRMVVPLALTISAVWLTNVPAALIAGYLVVLLLVIVTIQRRTSRVFLFGIAAMGLGLSLAAFYLVPATYERKWIAAAQLLSPGMRPFENFLFARTGAVERDSFLRMVSWLAVAELAVVGLALVGAQRWRRRNPNLWWSLAVSTCLAFVLMLPMAGVAYRLMPHLQFLQFPWRWLLVIGLAYAVFVVAGLPVFRGKVWLYGIAFLALIAACNRTFQPECDPAETPFMVSNLYHTGYGYMGADEYTPIGADNYEIRPDFPEYRPRTVNGVPAPDVHITKLRWSVDRKQLTIEAPKPVELELRLMNYPAWRIEVNGRPVTAKSDEATGRMIIALRGGRSDVDVRFTRTSDRWVGDAISLAAALVLAALFFHHRGTEAPKKRIVKQKRRAVGQPSAGFNSVWHRSATKIPTATAISALVRAV
jgi:hypothetical protein